MPIDYMIDQELGVLVVSASEEITTQDRILLVERLTLDTEVPDSVPILIDVSRITNPPTADDIPIMASLTERLGRRFKSKVAYFVVQPGLVTPYQLAAISVRSDQCEARTFTELSAAYKWLKNAAD